MNVIEVSGLTYRYGQFVAVAGVDFTVRQGEIFALLGTNGAGKTTTLEVVEGFRKPAGGRVRVFGLDPAADRAALSARTGVMSQQTGLIGELTVAETLALWAGLTSRKDSVPSLLSTVELTHRADVPVEKLSGGERRRLDFALAIWGRPPLVILDEPTTGLDPESRQHLWQTVEHLRDAGTSVLLTTHYLEEAQALADQVAIMHAGKVQVAGTLSEVLSEQPARITAKVPDVDLPKLLGDVSLVDGQLTVHTRDMQTDLYELLRWADRNAIRLRDLNASQASLQEIFLAIGKA
ncbi:ABC transporter ATP-binding protein [Kibdelosporangium persicum]|uniref:Daunorubicin/doxorubicin resistance ATP-binding protein DrrA n=1 Tax=Kibdelosporangium persicum TaxID=2698649 RepID=A0ABX2FFV8_9PSEU|nr:ABC transporter ATP-binding protein [Kibdelosporangium persicum]NRN69706.1 Daunorubicin/doxorubicin resistance ATP-binding protein DrrA [Kibdelosporangium persicum]